MNSKEEVFQKLIDWQYLKQLPETIDDFSLKIDVSKNVDIINIFNYEATELRKKTSCYYNCATKDYMLRKFFGLNEFCDIEFISPDFAEFEKILQNGFKKCIKEFADSNQEKGSHILNNKGLLDWEFGKKLPKQLEGFELYIEPCKPVRFNNGLFIVIDYSDFSTGNQLLIYFNELRDNFYAEKILSGTIYTTTKFDANSLKELEILLESGLEACLLEIKNKNEK